MGIIKYFDVMDGNWQIQKSFLTTFKTKVVNIENTRISDLIRFVVSCRAARLNLI